MKVLNNNEFNEEIKEGVTVIDFYADWCGPCKMLGPVLEEVAGEVSDVKFAKVNVDEAEEIAAKYRIMSIPAVFMFKNGEVVNKFVGYKGKDEVKDFVLANK